MKLGIPGQARPKCHTSLSGAMSRAPAGMIERSDHSKLWPSFKAGGLGGRQPPHDDPENDDSIRGKKL